LTTETSRAGMMGLVSIALLLTDDVESDFSVLIPGYSLSARERVAINEWQSMAGSGRRAVAWQSRRLNGDECKDGSGAAPQMRGMAMMAVSGASGVTRSYVGNHNAPRMLIYSFRDRILTVSASW